MDRIVVLKGKLYDKHERLESANYRGIPCQ
jgi:hypothetical protein